MENIADGPKGIILESVLEGMAEYYSATLSNRSLKSVQQKPNTSLILRTV